ncbi:MAG: hypothetical protein JXA04_09085 [Gammaproteobacteria bacterium]|nr:hypothetical protein [Gammaproteobacteria bacterium]
MTDGQLYQVVFDGTLTGKIASDKVKQNLAAMFKMSATQVEALFSGKPIVIKRNVDEDTATKYKLAFQNAGAICTLVAGNTTQSPSAAPVTSSVSRATGRMAGKDIVNKKIPADLGGLSMGKVGENIPTKSIEPEYELPDLSELSLAAEDGYLTNPSDIPEPKVNIKGLKMEDID